MIKPTQEPTQKEEEKILDWEDFPMNPKIIQAINDNIESEG